MNIILQIQHPHNLQRNDELLIPSSETIEDAIEEVKTLGKAIYGTKESPIEFIKVVDSIKTPNKSVRFYRKKGNYITGNIYILHKDHILTATQLWVDPEFKAHADSLEIKR